MKNKKLALIPTAALAVGAFLLLAPNASAAETTTKLNSADAKFIQEESASGVALVKIAGLGVKKAERADIREFAGMIVAGHGKANAELATLAKSKGVEVTWKDESKHAAAYQNLDGESGAKFDKEFLAVIVSSHKKCVKNFENASEDSEDNEVKQWAAKMLPALKAHLQTAEELQSAPRVETGVTPGRTSPGTASNRTSNGATSGRTSATEPDNTARNKRDRDAATSTPLDQGNSKNDIDTTAQIRKAILNLENLSVNARNVKIITNEGHVTLRGPVKTQEEKRLIGEIAEQIATSEHTDNQLEVEGATIAN